MMLTIFKLRLLQFFRLLKEIGAIRITIFSLIFSFIPLVVHHILASPENTVISLIAIGLLLIFIHSYRKDDRFLKIIIKNPYQIYLSEYLLLTLPFSIIWLFYHNWIGFGVLILIVLVVPTVNLNYLSSIIMLLINPFGSILNSKFNVSLPFISANSFEWLSGIRRKLLLLVPVYLFFLAFSFKPFIADVGIIFLSILIAGFYFYGEPREFVELLAKNPREFIMKKIFTNLKQLFIFFTPILVISLIFQTSTWYYLVGALVISLFIQVYTILYKYGLFVENTNLNRNIVFLLLIFLFIQSNEFIIVPIVLGIKSCINAVKNLKPYFND